MPVNQFVVAFEASDGLEQSVRAFVDAVEANPKANHQALLDEIAKYFLPEVLDAFLTGPVEVLGLEGTGAKIVGGLTSIVTKSGKALINKMLKGVSTEDQIKLAEHFANIHVEHNGKNYCAFPIDGEHANEAVLTFESYRQKSGDPKQMQHVMRFICDGAIAQFMDNTASSVQMGAINRGLVKTGRATISKAVHTMIDKNLTDLPFSYQTKLLGYFEELVLDVG